MCGLDEFSLVRERHCPLHGMRTRCRIVEADYLYSFRLYLHIHCRFQGGDGLVQCRLYIGGEDLRLCARQRRIAECVAKPVCICGIAFFRAEMVEGRNRQRIDGRGENRE